VRLGILAFSSHLPNPFSKRSFDYMAKRDEVGIGIKVLEHKDKDKEKIQCPI